MMTAPAKFRPLPVFNRELIESNRAMRGLRPSADADHRRAVEERHAAATFAVGAPIDRALAAVNGKAGTFTINSSIDVLDYADKAEGLLAAAGIPESERPGTVVTARPAGPWANAYRHAAVSTKVTLHRRRGGEWTLVSIERVEVWPKTPELYRVQISASAAECARRAALRPFDVRPAGNPQPQPATAPPHGMPEPEGP